MRHEWQLTSLFVITCQTTRTVNQRLFYRLEACGIFIPFFGSSNVKFVTYTVYKVSCCDPAFCNFPPITMTLSPKKKTSHAGVQVFGFVCQCDQTCLA